MSVERDSWEMIEHCLGAFVQFLSDPRCSEIMANPDGTVWVETHDRGVWQVPGVLDAGMRKNIIHAVASHSGVFCTPENPSIAGMLPFGKGRFQGMIPPAAKAPGFVIRLPHTHRIEVDDYLKEGIVTSEQLIAILEAVQNRSNLLIVGGTGSGKTTFANALLGTLSNSTDRVLVIEDTSEFECAAPNTFSIKVDRRGAFQYRDAVFDALRMRPDRIVVGELRDGAAALELLKAWNTGHRGGLTTLHANSARSALPRLEQLLMEVMEHPLRSLISEAVDVVVYLERYKPEGMPPARRVREVVLVADQLDAVGRYGMQRIEHHTV